MATCQHRTALQGGRGGGGDEGELHRSDRRRDRPALAGGEVLDIDPVLEHGRVLDHLCRHPVEQARRGLPDRCPHPPEPPRTRGQRLPADVPEGGLELGGGSGRQSLGPEQRTEGLGAHRPAPWPASSSPTVGGEAPPPPAPGSPGRPRTLQSLVSAARGPQPGLHGCRPRGAPGRLDRLVHYARIRDHWSTGDGSDAAGGPRHEGESWHWTSGGGPSGARSAPHGTEAGPPRRWSSWAVGSPDWPPPSSSPARGSARSPSSSSPGGWAAPGGTTSTRAAPAMSPPTSTRSPSLRRPTGRDGSQTSRRSSPTPSSWSIATGSAGTCGSARGSSRPPTTSRPAPGASG